MRGTRADDVELVRRAQAGDGDAFSLLIARYRRRLEGLAGRRLQDREEARDVVQDAVVRALQSLADLRDPAAFFSWLAATVASCCAGQSRKAARRRRLGNLGLVPDGERWYEVDEGLLAEELLARLPSARSTALRLYYVEGLGVDDVAAHLGKPVGTVKRWLHEGRRQLRRAMIAMSGPEAADVVMIGDLQEAELEIIGSAARELGLTVRHFTDPWEGWKWLREAGEEPERRPRLVVFARSLAEPDETFALLALLGPTSLSPTRLVDVPFLILGPSDEPIMYAAWSAGAAAYLSRPPNPEDFAKIMAHLVGEACRRSS